MVESIRKEFSNLKYKKPDYDRKIYSQAFWSKPPSNISPAVPDKGPNNISPIIMPDKGPNNISPTMPDKGPNNISPTMPNKGPNNISPVNPIAGESVCNAVNSCPLAMAYVPWQSWNQTYDPPKALDRGTLFPELDLPFFGGGAY